MNSSEETADPAAVFACAVSLRDACEAKAAACAINLSDTFNGGDQFWRELMRIGTLFETWACENVAFEVLEDVWPYRLEAQFGSASLERFDVGGLARFDATDCPVVAMTMQLPLWYRDGRHLPLDVSAPNPVAGSAFVKWRIQTVRLHAEDEEMVPMVYGDEPHDTDFEPPVVALYGVDAEGLLEHIRDSDSYAEARSLVMKLAPGVVFPEVPVVRVANDE